MWYISRSAKGSEWEEHIYLQEINGKYYYPDDYVGGRHLSLYKKKTEESKSSSSSSSSKSKSKNKSKAKLFDRKGLFNRKSLTDARNKAMGKGKSKSSSSSSSKKSGSKKSSSSSTKSPDSTESKSAKRVEEVVSKVEMNANNDVAKEKLSGTMGINEVITKYAKVSIKDLDKSQINSIKKKLQQKYGGTYT